MSSRLVKGASGGVTVKTGATRAAIGNGSVDGDLALLKIGTWPDTENVELYWDATNSVWVSKAHALMEMGDLSYMGVNTTAYSYISTSNSGAATGTMGWATRPVRHAADTYAAGFYLQIAATGIIIGTGVSATFTVMPFFFQNSDAEAVTFSSDGSAAIGWLGTPLVSPANSTITYKATGWQNLLKNTLGTTLTSVDVTKQNLWPRLYGKVGSGASYGSVIDVDVQYRWVG